MVAAPWRILASSNVSKESYVLDGLSTGIGFFNHFFLGLQEVNTSLANDRNNVVEEQHRSNLSMVFYELLIHQTFLDFWFCLF